MGDGFTTRVDALRGAAKAADTLADELRGQSERWLGEDGVDTGHAVLGQEMRAFVTRARVMADGFAVEGRAIGERLGASATAYEETDRDAAAVIAGVYGGDGA